MSERLRAAFRAEALAGLTLATAAQLIALAIIAFWLFVWVPPPRLFFLEAVLALFALVGLLHYRLARHDRAPSWWPYLVVTIYFILLPFSMLGYDLMFGDALPPQMMLRNGTIVYFFVYMVLVALSYSPRLVLWAGLAGAGCWSLGVYAIVRRPDTLTTLDQRPGDLVEQQLALRLDPRFVDLDVITQDVIVLLIVAGTLAAGAWRARRLVVREAALARERANLARYFAPTIVERLARADEPLGAVRAQPVGVLFADIVGFTRLAEREPPPRVIALLREFHARLEAAIFEHGGTLDKYLGDGLMATFGTPDARPDDAARALAAARAMLASIDAWNRDRAGAGQPPVRLAIGVHYGEVVLGDIGSARRLEFAVIGDVVNVASRLEQLTRQVGAALVVSDALVEAIRATPGIALEPVLAGLVRGAPQTLRGRAGAVPIWVLGGAP